MPQLSYENTVDLELSKDKNKDRKLLVKSFDQLKDLNIAERIRVIQYALTDDQRKMFEDYLIIEKQARNNLWAGLPALEYYQKKHLLVINKQIFSFESSLMAQGMLKALFKRNYIRTRKIAVKDFLFDNRELLRKHGIENESQIRSTKSYIKKRTQLSDMFISRYINLNPKYLP